MQGKTVSLGSPNSETKLVFPSEALVKQTELGLVSLGGYRILRDSYVVVPAKSENHHLHGSVEGLDVCMGLSWLVHELETVKRSLLGVMIR